MSEQSKTLDISIRRTGPRVDLVGRRYGKLVVLRYDSDSHWICACDCGGESRVLTANLNRDNTKSCGCVRNHAASIRNTKHGLHGTKEYKAWHGIKRRCCEPNHPSFKDYGAKGIKLWEGWLNDPKAFCDHIGKAPSIYHSVDRIDNSKGYEPGNIRWADKWEQANNKSSNRWVVFQGKEMTLAQLARYVADECGITAESFADALTSIVKERKRQALDHPQSEYRV